MSKRLINFRGTKDFARVENSKGERTITGNKVVWASCSQLTGVKLAYFKKLGPRALVRIGGEGMAGFIKRNEERKYNALPQSQKDLLAFMAGDVTGVKGTTFTGQINKAFLKTPKKIEPDVLGRIGADGGIYIANGMSWVQYSKPCKKKGEPKEKTADSGWVDRTKTPAKLPDIAESDNNLKLPDEYGN